MADSDHTHAEVADLLATATDVTARTCLSTPEQLHGLLERVAQACGVGTVTQYSPITEGIEDANFLVSTPDQQLVCKVFAATRDQANIRRNVNILNAIHNSDVAHPTMLVGPDGSVGVVDDTTGLTCVLMHAIAGQSFAQLDRGLTPREIDLVARQAALINQLDLHPPFLNDAWSITEFPAMCEQVTEYLTVDDRAAVTQALDLFRSVDLSALDQCFVHGDIIKGNVMLDANGGLWVLDFSVSNTYARAQELAVMAGNLLSDPARPGLSWRVDAIVDAYSKFTSISQRDADAVMSLAIAAAAMELCGSYLEVFVKNNDSDEMRYYQEIGRQGLVCGLAEVGR